MKEPGSSIQSFEDFQANSYFNALDGLRAVSILMVLLHHVPQFQQGLARTLQDNGRYGVAFFFVISGFLICTLFLREEARTGRIDLWKFKTRNSSGKNFRPTSFITATGWRQRPKALFCARGRSRWKNSFTWRLDY